MTADFTVTDAQVEAAGTVMREHGYVWAAVVNGKWQEASCACGEWTGSDEGRGHDHHAEHVARAALAAAGPSMVADAVAAESERILRIVAPHEPESGCSMCDKTRARVVRAGGDPT